MSLLATMAGMVTDRFTEILPEALDMEIIQDNVDVQTLPSNARYCRLALRLGLTEQPEAGTRMFRTTGVMLAQLFEPLGSGDGEQLEVVDYICDGFRGVTLTGPPIVAFSSPYISAPPIREGAFWLCVVAIPFRGDEFNE